MIPRPTEADLPTNAFAFRFWLDACHAIPLPDDAALHRWARLESDAARTLVLAFARLGSPASARLVLRGRARRSRVVLPPAWTDPALVWSALIAGDIRPDDRVLVPGRHRIARAVLAAGATLVRLPARKWGRLAPVLQEEGITMVIGDVAITAEDIVRWDLSALRRVGDPGAAPWEHWS